MSDFNLIDEPWIPCIDLQGRGVEYGIRDTLLKAHELSEICDDSPLVTVAIHRLLLAILYRAHAGPCDFRSWKALFQRGTFDQSKVIAYLNGHRSRFNLVDDDYPFFQMAKLETETPVPVTRLATECASGNNATLFDHTIDEEDVSWPAARAARWLVSCQSFALGFGKSGDATISGARETLPYSADAIALRGMNIWLQGATAFETLMINLAPSDDNSLPPWELEDSHKYRDKLKGKTRIHVSSFGIVDRFTWQSRLVRFLPQNGVFSRMYFTQGRSADKSPGDPMKVYRTSEDEGFSALPLSSSKAAWRDAHSIFTIPLGNSKEQRPECFNLLARTRSDGAIPPGKKFVVQIVGLASAPKKSGKFLLWRHERMPISVEILNDVNLIERLGELLQNAEQAAYELNYRTRGIVKLYLRPDGKEPDKDEVTKVAESIDPRPAYWARMEKYFFALLEHIPEDWDNAKEGWRPDEKQTVTNTWRESVKKEAMRALEESTRSLGTTVRAIQAIAQVRTDFNDDDLKPKQQTAAKKRTKGGKKK
jgi:CRISPR system Cascade subunit CasA